MSNIPQTFTGVIKKIYKKKGYLDLYGGDLIITGTILLIFWLIFAYHMVMAQIVPIKKDWVNRRCSPAVMPFAGIINAPPNVSKFTYTGSNFSSCIVQILKHIVAEVTKPISYATHAITKVINMFEKAIAEVRKVFATVRTDITKIVHSIMNRALNFLAPILAMIVKMKDLLMKTGGTMTAVLLTTLGIYDTLKSAIGAFIEFLIIMIILLVAAIIIAWIMPWTWPMAIIGTAIFVFLGVITSIILYWMVKIYDGTIAGGQAVPGSSCFDENTMIETMEGRKKIKSIHVGEKLADGSYVHALFKLSSRGEKMYNYHNVIVSGSHQLMSPTGKCVPIAQHPHSCLIDDYDKPYLYCLSTSTKKITIGGHIFSDWDEVDDGDWEHIKERAVAYLPRSPQKTDMHKYLENGLGGNTPIILQDGQIIYLKDVCVGDYLRDGEKVLGIVLIDGNNLLIKKYNIKGNMITCSPNVPFVNDILGNVTTLKMEGRRVYGEDKLYHLITDTKFFTIYGVKFHDYNGVVEEMIEGSKILFPSF